MIKQSLASKLRNVKARLVTAKRKAGGRRGNSAVNRLLEEKARLEARIRRAKKAADKKPKVSEAVRIQRKAKKRTTVPGLSKRKAASSWWDRKTKLAQRAYKKAHPGSTLKIKK